MDCHKWIKIVKYSFSIVLYTYCRGQQQQEFDVKKVCIFLQQNIMGYQEIALHAFVE